MHQFHKFILERNSTCFRHFLCPSSGVFHCTHSNGICHTGLLTACEQDQDGTSWSCSQAVYKSVWHIPMLRVQWKTPDDGQRKCPKHVEFLSKINLWNWCIWLVLFYKKKDDICLKIRKCRPTQGVIVLSLPHVTFPCKLPPLPYLQSTLLCWTDWVDHAIMFRRLTVFSTSIRTSQRTWSELSLFCRKLLSS